MHLIRTLTVFGLGAMFWALVQAETVLTVPRNAYLIRPVSSAKELADQIRSEPIVAQRYARHFGRNAWELADFFEQNLRLSRLERDQQFNVYYAPPNNQLMVVRKTLPKGTPVFVNRRDNKPVLKADCGNPLTPVVSLPPDTVPTVNEAVISVANPEPVMAEVATRPQVPLVELVEVPIEEVVAADVFPPDVITPEVEPPVVEAMPTEPIPEPIETIARTNLGPFLPLLLLGGVRFGGGDDFEPIPEPTSLLVLTGGLGLLYPFSRRALRRAQKSSQPTESSKTDSA